MYFYSVNIISLFHLRKNHSLNNLGKSSLEKNPVSPNLVSQRSQFSPQLPLRSLESLENPESLEHPKHPEPPEHLKHPEPLEHLNLQNLQKLHLEEVVPLALLEHPVHRKVQSNQVVPLEHLVVPKNLVVVHPEPQVVLEALVDQEVLVVLVALEDPESQVAHQEPLEHQADPVDQVDHLEKLQKVEVLLVQRPLDLLVPRGLL